jgi:hypothetical protein
MNDEKQKRLYCYVDESADKPSDIFVVAVVVTDENHETLMTVCEKLEAASGKGRAKWRKASWEARMRYIRFVCADERFHKSLCYLLRFDSPDIHEATIDAIARAIGIRIDEKNDEGVKASVYVDALSKEKRHEYAVALRRMGVPIYQVRGVAKEENNALIRLADALAGWVNDAVASEYPDAIEALQRAEQNGTTVKL